MSDMVKIENLKSLIIEIGGHGVLLDSDVAQIYGVETKDINKAVANNPDKFPDGYTVVLSKSEKTELVENFHRFERLKHSTVNPKAFTEQGLYMLATILKSPVATQATISIIETFTKIRELSRSVNLKTVMGYVGANSFARARGYVRMNSHLQKQLNKYDIHHQPAGLFGLSTR